MFWIGGEILGSPVASRTAIWKCFKRLEALGFILDTKRTLSGHVLTEEEPGLICCYIGDVSRKSFVSTFTSNDGVRMLQHEMHQNCGFNIVHLYI